MRDQFRRICGLLKDWLSDLTSDDWLLAAVSGKKSLTIRVQHILEGPRSSPASGRLWTSFMVLAASLCAMGLALAQARPGDSPLGKGKDKPTANAKGPVPVQRRTIRGTVTSQAGGPVAKATVYWYAHPRPRTIYGVSPPVMPRGLDRKPVEREELISKLATDETGRFASSAELDTGRYYEDPRIVVLADGAGLVSRYVRKGENELVLKLHPEIMVKGRLLTPSGTPAQGVRVSVFRILGESSAE